jgi:metal-dependent amidase/aminoacylase/carboxypeptidase family protein
MELDAIMNESESIKDWIIDIRRELHRFPELMYEEHRTNALVREKLASRIQKSFRGSAW